MKVMSMQMRGLEQHASRPGVARLSEPARSLPKAQKHVRRGPGSVADRQVFRAAAAPTTTLEPAVKRVNPKSDKFEVIKLAQSC